jgi:LmbE family N-acetylglucosaminyl deacetylase
MTLRALAATVTLFASALAGTAQQPVPQFTDPANLRGERVKPRDGRELPIDQGARGLEQMLRKLNTRASLMLIVAHPDDEDGGMLTYYSRGLGARVAVLTLTRGEGGQNAMTGDFEDALGLLRTQELLSADRYLGVDQFFGTEVDFGFSKTKEEAFKKWTHERVLYDAVRAIRLYRPLVIAAVFIGGVTDGHGQHQVSGQIAQEAFKAAADPTVFPDMIAEGILPWQPLKVYARVPMQSISDKGLFDYATGKYTAPRFENYVTGEVTTTTPTADVIVHEGTVDKLLSDDPAAPPRTYVQFARIGLGMQKSQIGGGFRVPPAGVFDVAYHRYGSKLANQPQHETSFFDGIDISIGGIATLAPDAKGNIAIVIKSNLAGISQSIAESQLDIKPGHPELAAHRLAEALKLTQMSIENIESIKREFLSDDAKFNMLHELRVKQAQLNEALVTALSLHLEASAPSEDITNGSPIAVELNLTNRSHEWAGDIQCGLRNSQGQEIDDALLPHEESVGFSQGRPIKRTLSADLRFTGFITRPYFFRTDLEQSNYILRVNELRNAPQTIPAITAWCKAQYDGTFFELRTMVASNNQPVSFVPPTSVALSSHAQILSSNQNEFTISAHITPEKRPLRGLRIYQPAGWSSKPPQASITESGLIDLKIEVPKQDRVITKLDIGAKSPDGPTFTEGYRPIGYGDLPRTNYYTPATVRIVPVDLNLPTTHRIAYLPGTGDAVPEALTSINLKPDILTVADLTPAILAQYDTVILGVRTYAAHPDLHGAPTQALLDYARNGGNVLVQYQTTEFTAADAPYPLDLGSNERVVDETDPVQLLDTKAPFLNTPNKITPADFNNWVEERGHGFLGSWDPHYTALTETHDPDQDPQRGGLITTNVGKGRWTYCAFALYRQLPEAVPGAFRLFVNLLSTQH